SFVVKISVLKMELNGCNNVLASVFHQNRGRFGRSWEMKRRGFINRSVALMLVLILLFAPAVVLATPGGKYFKQGRKYEAAQQWDLAAEQFALALNKEPDNADYKLHLIRSLTNASLMFMERGKMLVEQKDYEGAYQAFRQAYSYDK